MFYEMELQFLWDIFEKCRLQVLLLAKEQPVPHQLDLGLRHQLGLEQEYDRLWALLRQIVKPHTIYRMTDPFLCSYLILELPEREERAFLSVGPYLAVEPTREQLLEQAERLGIPPGGAKELEKYYGAVPRLTEQSAIFAPLETFCERLWGKENYSMVDVNQELYYAAPLPLENGFKEAPEEVFRRMQEMEERYAYENELMRAVSLGLTHRAELLLAGFSNFVFERRLADPVRNLKNYAIIMNTLLRKAAEQGGVHPLYLDNLSSEFAGRIEQISSAAAGYGLMTDMYRGYCRLVRRHTAKGYSPAVQRAIVHIDSDINGDLSLKRLAELQRINPSYLSTLFKKETGQTVTEYVSRRRVHMAIRLLNTTRLQIQTIAQHCGIPDVNYFTKIFKRYVGKTPKQFRLENMGLSWEGDGGENIRI